MTCVEGMLVDVVRGRLVPSRITYTSGDITSIEPLDRVVEGYILPGLIDSHIHIESSLLVPSRFAQAAVPHGTTGVVYDPHEIANVLGREGVRYMMDEFADVPMRAHLAIPSCVPATPWETSGSRLGPEDVREMLGWDGVVALAEMMDFPGVIAGEAGPLAKIAAASERGLPVDGHCPGLIGERLERYVAAGISTDHESLTSEEAGEKHALGMLVQVREGSASRNMGDLAPFMRTHECALVSDDVHVSDLVSRGHVDHLLRRAVALGMDPVSAVRAVTLVPATHYGLPGGSIEPGRAADLVIVDDLRDFRVREVIIGGVTVASDGVASFDVSPRPLRTAVLPQHRRPEEFLIPHADGAVGVRVMEAEDGSIETMASTVELEAIDGYVGTTRDVSTIAVVNRYADAPVALGLIRGFGIERGAIASTIAHDSHNIVAVGADAHSICEAVNTVSRHGGHVVCGEQTTSLELDVAGLMSTRSAEEVAADERELLDAAREMGCRLSAPFMTLSFQCLLVVPELKISDRGLFDVAAMRFVDPVLDRQS